MPNDPPPDRERPLRGLRIAVTRPAGADDPLVDGVEAAGAEALVVPLIRIAAATDPAPLQAAVAALDAYDWIVFTSANGVHALRQALGERTGGRPRARVAAVGPATARAIREALGWGVDAMPDRFIGDAVAAAMAATAPLRGSRVLWPRAAEAREALPRDLAAAGARLDAPVAYETQPLPSAAEALSRLLREGAVDVVTLTSPSAVRCLAAAAPDLGATVVAVIGPATAAAARTAGLPVHVEPADHTIPGLVDALARHFAPG